MANTMGGTVTGRKAKKSTSARPRIVERRTAQDTARLSATVTVGTKAMRIAVLRMPRHNSSAGMVVKLATDIWAHAAAEGGCRNGNADAHISMRIGRT